MNGCVFQIPAAPSYSILSEVTPRVLLCGTKIISRRHMSCFVLTKHIIGQERTP
jgi:hypothetical protein